MSHMVATSSPGRGIMFLLFAILILSPMTPFADMIVDEVEAAGVARHVYEFSDGSAEYIALFQGANPDTGAQITLPKGALVTDVTMTLSGASATGWSQKVTDDRAEWIRGTDSMTDSRSGDLSLALSSPEHIFFPHGYDENVSSNSDAWLDNGSYSLRQPHTSNSTESRFSTQVTKTSSSLMAQGQGAVLKHHDWLFLSTWTSSKFSNVVQKLYPNNASRHSTITLDKAECTLPQKHSSSYYGQYGFRDWTITDDERLFGILSGYKYTYSSSAPTQYHRVIEMDISRDDVWTCIDSYDVSPQYGDYTGIAYDREQDLVWILHNSQRRIVPYTFDGNSPGQYTRGQESYSYSSTGGSTWECGETGKIVRGLEVNATTFFMRCQKGTVYNDKDQLEAWAISGQSSSLVPQSGIKQVSALGYGLQFDGERFVTVDSGYSTWSSNTLYYREYGTGWQYETTPAPGTTTWYGPVTQSSENVVAANMVTYSSAASIGDRVDYWISADNGTHWQQVESNETIHFDFPGKELVWKAQLIGTTAVSWWVDLEYSTTYASSGSWISPYYPTGTKVGKVRPVWVSDEPSGSTVQVMVSNDNGTTWLPAINGQETSFSTDGAGDILRYTIDITSNDITTTPLIDSFILNYEEGYPDRPKLDIANDGQWDWESLQFLNESSVEVSDDSVVGVDVKFAPTMIQAFNDAIPENGFGDVLVSIGVKAATSGRIKISNIDVAYKMQTRAIDASLEGGQVSPDGVYRNLVVRVANGDEVDRVTKTVVALEHSYGDNPKFSWVRGDSCSTINDVGGIVQFDTANCTSMTDANGLLNIRMPMKVNWTWDDESSAQAYISVEDDLGTAVNSWETEALDLKVENDIQLDGLRVWEETGRELYSLDWVRGGFNLSFSGQIHFQGSQLSPEAGNFNLRILGQNVTHDGVPIGEPMLLVEEANPAFGDYNITIQSPLESSPGGMVFYVQAVNMINGSTFVNPGYNSIRLVLDGNSPLLLSVNPADGLERHAAPPGSGQSVDVFIQDSVDPPTQITLNYWIGCRANEALGCTDYNFDGLPNADEYELKTLSSPETRAGGLNIFQGSIDDSMLQHGQYVSFFVTGKDAQQNAVAMGGGPVCPDSANPCGYAPGEAVPDWSADLSTYRIREEFEPALDLSNSTVIGHNDLEPLHPGIAYTAQIVLSDRNGWRDIQTVQLALGGDFSDDDNSIFITLQDDGTGQPMALMESGSDNIAVSNIYSSVELNENNDSIIIIKARFQLTWTFPETFDTNGLSNFIPKILVTDLPCNDGEETPCFEAEAGLGNDWWSLDNDFRFDTMEGHIRAIELRDSTNHYNSEIAETLIGAGQALRVSGRVLFSEDEMPAPAGAFDVIFGDYDHEWKTSTRLDGEFSLDLLIPAVRSGHLDLRLKLDDLPGLAFDETNFVPRVRLAVDSSRPTISSIILNDVSSGGELSIGDCADLLVMLETIDDHGFNMNEPAVLHYRVRAGEAEISRGSLPLPDTTPFGEQFFWTGHLDLTDSGATMLLPSYVVDVWISGSDESGNPFDIYFNSVDEPYASWNLALLGPSFNLNADTTSLIWDEPSPITGQQVNMVVKAKNSGGKGDVAFVLQRLIVGGNWAEISTVSLEAGAGADIQASLGAIADVEAGEQIEFRVLVLVDGVEMDRKTVDPLIIKHQTSRDADALKEQASEDQFTIILFVIAILSVGFGVYTMVVSRRILRDEEFEESDQTAEVLADINTKELPEIDMNLPPPPGLVFPPPNTLAGNLPAPIPPPLAPADTDAAEEDAEESRGEPPIPPSGLPDGWSQDQWEHFGWQYLDALND